MTGQSKINRRWRLALKSETVSPFFRVTASCAKQSGSFLPLRAQQSNLNTLKTRLLHQTNIRGSQRQSLGRNCFGNEKARFAR